MVLNYFGEGCFRLQSGDLSLLVNPLNNRLKADVVLRTLALPDDPIVPEEISFPGEYEMKGIDITGIGLAGESSAKILKTVYSVRWEDMHFLFLGHISQPLNAAVLEELDSPDIVFVPTGDEHFIDPEAALKLVHQLRPKVVIPAYYPPTGRQVKSLDKFLAAAGVKPETEEKLVFRKKDLGEGEKMRVVVLEAKG